ncbi:phenylalanyl-tRNA synthetase, beta subunit [Lancefieldella parvula DSM 20469]|uniref:Phenylalanine--tRNA ligase beta subunit n=1 Tax=Lancefieldella parvula (strain ATCC 33793 / DSM 20469 / CCUG 32760 / JCM 10300 / KCTC 3663 / VPI 0546 / 1246) TaxID=521095 RepID=C8W7P1_LANP1|nr:phenylalanine--tRNA ligase subunit beta [Lancefieldella parvula]ACV51482.1 phenylalanyl-tRNA synthetase, beta subunit [Lancefieldella parvula DSM 20469]
MRVSYEWLKTLVDLPQDPKDLEREFVRTGTEVEAVERVGANLDHVVTAQVVSKEPHPDSDHMYVTLVDVGKNNVDKDGNPVPLQIVCGAQNFNQGDHIVTAMIGAVLPGDFKIKKSKLRGVESYGMNCSSRELGLGDDQSGIMILPEDAPIGVPLTDYLGMSDVVLDCEITPNRPDCLSMTGMAVEVSAMYDIDTHIELPSVTSESGQNASDQVDVTITDPDLCPRYTARVVRNVKIGPSPEWLARRVTACGGRSINNVVDVTNYVMYLTGQPLHAFDLGKLTKEDGKYHIVVRAAKDGEHIVTLDGEDRELTSDMTVITDNGKTPIALAGVMGGMDSEITENTVDVLLESAVFDNGHISRTSRNLDLMSEASIRYERLVDPNGCASVADIAAALFEECCGAEVCPGIVDVYPKVKEAVTIALRPERVCALAGVQIPEEFMVSRLTRLGCKVTPADDGNLSVVAPTNRPDLTREVDLIEEIVRLWGEGDIEATLPAARNHAGGLTLEQRQIRKIGRTLRSLGLNETKSYLFASPDDLSKLGMSEEGRGVPVKVISPLVADQSEMRRSIVPGLLRSIAYNLAHGVSNIAMYELGRVLFGHKDKSQPDEPRYVCGVLVGRPADDTWNAKYLAYDFFDAKGIVEGLLEALRIPKVRFRVAEPEQYGWLQPGRAAEILAGSETIGWVGNIHPLSLQNFDIEVPVIAFEISVASLLRLSQKDLPIVEPPTYPGISIDLAIVVDESVTAEQLVQRLKSAGGKLLCDIRLFDVYRDALRVGKGKKSMAFSLTYRADDRTLTSEEVEKTHAKLVEKVLRSTGGEIRG